MLGGKDSKYEDSRTRSRFSEGLSGGRERKNSGDRSRGKSSEGVFMYTPGEYQQALEDMPGVIDEIIKMGAHLLEPTVEERKQVYAAIRTFIAARDRIVYGGTALDESVGAIEPADRFYNDYNRSDIEFYSPEPIQDLIDLTNTLHRAGFQRVVGKEAQHMGSYNVIVDFELYCDITYMPKLVYHRVQTNKIGNIRYAHPHFLLIDGLRIFTQPLTAADFRWEKTLKRMYLLTKHYPLPFRTPRDPRQKVDNDAVSCIGFLLTDYLGAANPHNMMITGMHAYNWYLGHVIGHKKIQKVASASVDKLIKQRIPVYMAEFCAEHYAEAVKDVWDALKIKVPDAKKLSIKEYHPFFQFTLRSAIISYQGVPVCRIYSTEGLCVPIQSSGDAFPYVSYQYLLMYLLIQRFRAYIDGDKDLEQMYGGAASILLYAKNIWCSTLRLRPHNDTVFAEYVGTCLGKTMNFRRESFLRSHERYKAGKHPFRYEPQKFFNKTEEERERFNPTRFNFPNISGNVINNPNAMIWINSGEDLIRSGLEEEDLSDLDGSSYESDFSEEWD